MTLRTYYPDRHEPPEPVEAVRDTGDPHNIAWGYNLADLDQFSRMAISRSRGRWGSHLDRYQTAWSAIAEALCTSEEAPDAADLVHAGWAAVAAEAERSSQSHGHSPHRGRMPAFERYWTPVAGTTVEERIVESHALWQIMPALTDRQRQALTALAATGDYQVAALGMQLSYHTYAQAVSRARKAFAALWFEGETPPRHRHDKHRTVTSRITASQLEELRDRYYEGTSQGVLAAEVGLSGSTLSALLSGKSRPAPDPVEAS